MTGAATPEIAKRMGSALWWVGIVALALWGLWLNLDAHDRTGSALAFALALAASFVMGGRVADRRRRRPQIQHLARPLTFVEVIEANRARSARWHHENTEPWTGADWSNAMCGEAGETANVVKKLRRHETGYAHQGDPTVAELRAALADEIADTFLYLALLADHYRIDMPAAIVAKFNRVSERRGFPDRLGDVEEVA